MTTPKEQREDTITDLFNEVKKSFASGNTFHAITTGLSIAQITVLNIERIANALEERNARDRQS